MDPFILTSVTLVVHVPPVAKLCSTVYKLHITLPSTKFEHIERQKRVPFGNLYYRLIQSCFRLHQCDTTAKKRASKMFAKKFLKSLLFGTMTSL